MMLNYSFTILSVILPALQHPKLITQKYLPQCACSLKKETIDVFL